MDVDRSSLQANSVCLQYTVMHGSEWTLKYDEPEVENVPRECDIFNWGSSYFNVARTTVFPMFCRMANH